MWLKSFGQRLWVKCSLPYQRCVSTETTHTLINILPTPPDVRAMGLSLNIESMCVLIFLPAFLCVSVHIFACVGASIDSHFRCICVGFPLLCGCVSHYPKLSLHGACRYVFSDCTPSGEIYNHPSTMCKKSADDGQPASQPDHS